MYLTFCCLCLSLLLPFLGSASAMQAAQESKLHASPQGRALPIQANSASMDSCNASTNGAATVRVETSAGNTVAVRCDARVYGAGLNASSCFSALSQSPTSDVQES